MKRGLIACVLAVLFAIPGCGAGTGSGAPAPAALAPANSLAFATFDIAPEGSAKAGFDAAFGKLLGAPPEIGLGEAFTRAAESSGRLDYLNDVKPWLGNTLSVVVTGVGPKSADFALLAASTDDAKAQAAIDRDVAGSGAHDASYRGVGYKLLGDGTANGIVSHFLVAGSEAAFKAVVDTSKDGASLAASEQWKTSVGARGDGKVGLAYVDLKGLLQSLASQLPGAQRIAAPLLLGLLQLHPFVATLEALPDRLVVDVSSPGTKADPRGPAAASSPLIEQLPADSWFAAALPGVGPTFEKVVTALKANPLIAAAYTQRAAAFKTKTGIDIERDLLGAVGDLAVFARGTSPATAGGAIVVQSPKPPTLARTIARLRDRFAPPTPQPIVVRAAGRRAIAAYGTAAARAALHPAALLGNSLLFAKARAAIGQRPTLFIDFARALAVGAASPHHRGDAPFQQALPRLRHIAYIAAGAFRDGGIDVVRAVVGIR